MLEKLDTHMKFELEMWIFESYDRLYVGTFVFCSQSTELSHSIQQSDTK